MELTGILWQTQSRILTNFNARIHFWLLGKTLIKCHVHEIFPTVVIHIFPIVKSPKSQSNVMSIGTAKGEHNTHCFGLMRYDKWFLFSKWLDLGNWFWRSHQFHSNKLQAVADSLIDKSWQIELFDTHYFNSFNFRSVNVEFLFLNALIIDWHWFCKPWK